MEIFLEESKIPSSFEEAHEVVKGLIRDFQAKESYYLKSDYQEAETRKDFIDKFFIALGWDVNHDVQKNPYEQEVKVEPSIEVEGRNKRADYSFALAPNYRDPRFYAEAKKPSSDLLNPQSIFQTIRYAWNRSTPIAVLTNFYQFHVVDCRFKPSIDTAINRGIKELQFHYTDFLKEETFRKVYHLFSQSSVQDGSLEKFADDLPHPRGKAVQKGLFKGGYQKIDDTFLIELDDYRLVLAKAFKKNNPKLESYALTEAVQRTIDRLVFIRFLEDKLIEEKDHVSNFGDGGSSWKDFVNTCRQLDPKYNGLIFHEHFILDKPSFSPPDDEDFGDICERLAHVNSPYDFNAIPIDILGSIYERFLGKIIQTSNKQVKVEEKPQVKKAGGVFYTPQYIVQAIVENTVGKKVEGKNPERIAKMRFADISCGSGSFLLGVYDYLIHYHARYYQKYPKEAKIGDFEEHDGKAVLSLRKKREILKNNIFGVDIDPQAVEVTQLSLYLKLLEEETTASTNQTQLEFKEAILPSLNKNIKCGNSLIGADYFSGQLIPDEDVMRRINPFDWETEFKEILKEGGFDCLIGNPPYIRIQVLNKTDPKFSDLLKVKYESAAGGNYDIYVVFVEKALGLLNETGSLGYILPSKFFTTDYGFGLRNYISKMKVLSKIIDFAHEQVFETATTYTCLLFLDKSKPEIVKYSKISPVSLKTADPINFQEISANEIKGDVWIFGSKSDRNLVSKIYKKSKTLIDLPSYISRGSSSGMDDVYVLKKVGNRLYNGFDEEVNIEKGLLKQPIFATDFNRYTFTPNNQKLIILPYEISSSGYEIIEEKGLKKKFPKTFDYLLGKKKQLQTRKQFKEWYGFSAPRNLNLHIQADILVPLLADKGMYCMLPREKDKFCLMAGGGFSITVGTPEKISPYYVIGLLNSKLLFWHLKNISNKFRGGWITCTKQYVETLPIKIEYEKSSYAKVIECVTKIQEYTERLSVLESDADRAIYTRQIDSLENQLNYEVYSLYELEQSEIDLVENAK